MSIEKDLKDLKTIRREINELHIKLKEFKIEKDLLEGELRIASKDETIGLKEKLFKVVESIKATEKMLKEKKRNAEVLEIITSVSGAPEKEEKQSESKRTPTRDEVSEIINSVTRDEVSEIINSLKSRRAGNQTHSGVNQVVSQTHNSKPEKNIGGIKNKISALFASVKNGFLNMREKRNLSKLQTMSTSKLPEPKKPTVRKPEAQKPKRYKGRPGERTRLATYIMASALALGSAVFATGAIKNTLDKEKFTDDSILFSNHQTSDNRGYLDSSDKEVDLENSEMIIRKGDNDSPKVSFQASKDNTNSEKSGNRVLASLSNERFKAPLEAEEDRVPTSLPNQEFKAPSEIDTNLKTEETNKTENQIKKIYGGEISASENGIRTEEDILYAATQMGWSEDRIENIKKMMQGLLDAQRDFDIDPLFELALAQWESGCGTAYTKYNQIRVFNITDWDGELGVVGHTSKMSYGVYDTWYHVAYDFGNYVRNGPPYTESPALAMKDLRAHGEYTWIFGSAGEEGEATYNQLKDCLARRVTIDEISVAVEECTASEIKEMTDSIKSSIEMENSVNQEMAGR